MAILHNLDERTHILPLIAPIDAAANAQTTGYVDMSKYNQVQFVIFCGAADSVGGFALEQSTTADSTGTEAGLGFFFRKSGAVGTDTMGAITHVVSTDSQATLAADDAVIYIVEPDQLDDGKRWCRLVFTPSATAASTLISIHAVLSGARYAGNVMVSAT
jgi:hypothetical protein